MLKKSISFVLLLVLLAVFSGCGKKDSAGNDNATSKGQAGAATGNFEGQRPTDVKVAKLALTDAKDVYTVPGVAEAWDVVAVATETSGPITWIGKEEGDEVKAGEPIMKIDTENLTATLNSRKVELASKEKDFARTDNLYKQGSVSLKSFEDATDALSLAKVNYKLALEEFNKGVVKSPINGAINEVPPKKGEYVTPGTLAATVVNLDKLKIYVEVPEKDIAFLKLGQEVDIYPADMAVNPEKIKGQINFISVTSDPKTLTYKARIDIDNRGNITNIKPGRIVRADIVRRDLKNVILADIYAVIDKNGTKYVFLDKNGKAEERKVEVGPMIDRNVVITSGLAAGDDLIISGQQFLTAGAPIRVAQ